MRKLAELVAHEHPDVLAVCEIKPGDALSLATRFDLQWAYRGRQALFWSGAFSASEVQGEYLPLQAPLFGRRGFLRVDGTLAGKPCTIVATQFARNRAARLAELRFARQQLRGMPGAVMLFAGERMYTRGFDLGEFRLKTATV